MGCGCGNKLSKSKVATKTAQDIKKEATAIRKNRVSKLISIPGKSTVKK